MSAVIEILQGIGGFTAGLLLRIGLVLLVVVALLVPVMLGMGAVQLWRTVRPAWRGLRRAGNALYKPGLRYASGHTWLERDGKRLRIGIDGVAQEILPWALAVHLPRLGQKLQEGQIAALVSCGTLEAPITSPLEGTVVAVNPDVLSDPSLIKADGYGQGWLFAVEPADARWSTLPVGELARDWLKGESERLQVFLEDRLGLAGLRARSGPAPDVITHADWRDLTRSFLQA